MPDLSTRCRSTAGKPSYALPSYTCTLHSPYHTSRDLPKAMHRRCRCHAPPEEDLYSRHKHPLLVGLAGANLREMLTQCRLDRIVRHFRESANLALARSRLHAHARMLIPGLQSLQQVRFTQRTIYHSLFELLHVFRAQRLRRRLTTRL